MVSRPMSAVILGLNAMSQTTMVQATAILSWVGAERVSEAVSRPSRPAGSRERLTPCQADGRSNGLSYVVAGLLAKHQDSPGVLIVAKAAGRPCSSSFRDAAGNVIEFDLEDLVRTVVAAFRSQPHINNVLTHLSGGKWERVGQALHIILNPLATLNDLSPLDKNIIELMYAERGVTGRMLKPYFHALLAKAEPPQTAVYLRTHVLRLLLEMQARDACLSQATGEPRNLVAARGV